MKKSYLTFLLSLGGYGIAHAQPQPINFNRLEAEATRTFQNGILEFQDSANYTFTSNNNYYDTLLDRCGYNTGRYYDAQKDVVEVDTHGFHSNTRIATNNNWRDFGSGMVHSIFWRYEYSAGTSPLLTAAIRVNMTTPADSTKEVYAYNSLGQQIEYRIESWDNTNSVWEVHMRYTRHYNSSNQLEQILSQQWQPLTSSWEDVYRTTYTWPASNKKLELMEQYNMGVWQNSVKTEYTEAGGQVMNAETWLWFSGAWDKDSRVTYTYSGMGVTEYLYETHNGISYDNSSQTTYAYSPGLVVETRKSWNFMTNKFEMMAGNEEIRKYYQKGTGIADAPAAAMAMLRVYPVPARDVLHVQATTEGTLPAMLYITDMQGRTLQQTPLHPRAGTADELVDISNLPAGNYLLRVSSGRHQSFEKITVVK